MDKIVKEAKSNQEQATTNFLNAKIVEMEQQHQDKINEMNKNYNLQREKDINDLYNEITSKITSKIEKDVTHKFEQKYSIWKDKFKKSVHLD